MLRVSLQSILSSNFRIYYGRVVLVDEGSRFLTPTIFPPSHHTPTGFQLQHCSNSNFVPPNSNIWILLDTIYYSRIKLIFTALLFIILEEQNSFLQFYSTRTKLQPVIHSHQSPTGNSPPPVSHQRWEGI